ncbi:MAG: IgGFc-binding protein [Myxococcales bacterium]|nr:IgGFc-binding protein [Myxococcales bacterium]
MSRMTYTSFAVALALGACGDEEAGQSASDSASVTAASGLTTLSTSAGTSTGAGTTEGGSGGSESGASDSDSTGEVPSVKWDLGEPMGWDFPPDDDGPPIPTTCVEAEAGKSTVGCLFFAVDMDAHDSVENQQYAVAVANVQLDATATVTIERKQGGVWGVVGGPQQIAALDLFTFNLPPNSTDDSAVREGGAYRVSSDVPVVAYQFNPVDGSTSYLSDASMLYPVPALDTINDVVGWTSMQDNTNTFQHGYATIVATADGTQVTVTPGPATAAGNGVPMGQPGVPFQVALNEGDVLSVAVQSLATSMTGTKVVSNDGHPVAVFSGQECALIPASTCCCDHLEEQIAGLRQWGQNFVASRMPVRNEGSPETSLWQIYASEDGTQITINADPGVTGIDNPNLMLNKGQMVELYVGGPLSEPGDFEVIASKPIGVFNYMTGSENMPAPYSQTGDPAMVQLSPIEQYLPRYVVLVPGTWVNDVAVITRAVGATVTIDDVPVNDAAFNPVANSGYEVARVPIPDGVHVLDGGEDPFGVVIVGYDSWDSYAYLGGTGTGTINPNPPG